MVSVAQLAEHWVVASVVVGSSPITHPYTVAQFNSARLEIRRSQVGILSGVQAFQNIIIPVCLSDFYNVFPAVYSEFYHLFYFMKDCIIGLATYKKLNFLEKLGFFFHF